jgi:hypothetical protein
MLKHNLQDFVVSFLSQANPPERVGAMVTINGGEAVKIR